MWPAAGVLLGAHAPQAPPSKARQCATRLPDAGLRPVGYGRERLRGRSGRGLSRPHEAGHPVGRGRTPRGAPDRARDPDPRAALGDQVPATSACPETLDGRTRRAERVLLRLAVHPLGRLLAGGPARQAAGAVLNKFAINGLIERDGAAAEPAQHDGAVHVLAVAHRPHIQRAPPPTGADRRARRPRPTPDGPPSAGRGRRSSARGHDGNARSRRVLFAFFAQWFTDGFLRTARDLPRTGPTRHAQERVDPRDRPVAALRADAGGHPRSCVTDRGGLLKHQIINGEEYPPYYCKPAAPASRSSTSCPKPLGFDGLSPDGQGPALRHAAPTSRTSAPSPSTSLFLREHNRIARRLSREYPTLGRRPRSSRPHATSSQSCCCNHRRGVHQPHHARAASSSACPGSFANEPWQRPNWMAIEFNLLYRWHSLVPLDAPPHGADLPTRRTRLLNTAPARRARGLGPFMAAASQPAGRAIGLCNTDPLPCPAGGDAEHQAGPDRAAGVLQRLPPACACLRQPSFERDLLRSQTYRRRSQRLYGNVEDVEFYVGLFAEDIVAQRRAAGAHVRRWSRTTPSPRR